MRIYKEDNQNKIDLSGCIIFTTNSVAINFETDPNPCTTVENGIFIGLGRGGFIARIKNCIRLYKFMKTGSIVR